MAGDREMEDEGYDTALCNICSSACANMSTDLHKVYVDDEHYNSGHGHAYARYEVEPAVGAVVIVRPDQCELILPP